MDIATNRVRRGSSKRAEPTQDRFLQLVEQYDNLLSLQSILSKQKSEQRTEEIKKRLNAWLPFGPRIVDNTMIASRFTEEELMDPMLAPIKGMALVQQAIHSTLIEIKAVCTEISFDGFIEETFPKGKVPRRFGRLFKFLKSD